MISPDQWAFIRDLGFGGLMLVALIGGARGWYVWQWTHRELKADRDFWRSLALRSLGTADKALDAAVAKKSDEA